MPKTRVEKIASIEKEMALLAEQRRTLLDKEKELAKKARTHRLCKRGGLLEKMLPDTIALTDEQFLSFLEMTVANDFGRRALDRLTGKNTAANPAPEGGGGSAAQPNHNQKPQQTGQNGGTGTPQNGTTTPSE